jgi:exonuclease III
VRLLTWNLNGRRKVDGQTAAIADRCPDVVALQEVTAPSTTLLREALAGIGLPHVIDSFASSPEWKPVGPRKYGLLIGSRFPLAFVASTEVVPWPERVLSAAVVTPRGAIVIHTTHIPPGCTNGWMKVEMLEAVSAVASAPSPTPCILCGDFNVPQVETAQGRIVTWAEELVKVGEPRLCRRKQGGDARRWDAAERTVMEGGPQRNLIDAFRQLHGYGREEFSWFVRRGTNRTGRRFDHIFCSRDVGVERCEYVQSVREDGLSDHAALELDCEL